MTPRNLTELRKANDNHTQTDRNTTGGISADVLPRGSVLSGTLEIRVLEQMPRRGNPAHSHFLPLLPSPPIRPRNLPQRPHTMKTGILPPRNLFGLLDQSEPTGPKKLAVFRRACTLMQVPFSPDNYDENGKAKKSLFHVRIFNPAGSWVWYITDWDGEDLCFGLVRGFEEEWGSFSLSELSMIPGPFGIGLEVDVCFQPIPYSAFLSRKEPR